MLLCKPLAKALSLTVAMRMTTVMIRVEKVNQRAIRPFKRAFKMNVTL
jgi:hypothetical protein